MRKSLLAILLLATTAFAVTYSQPFAAGHGFTASQSGACDSSYVDADDSTNGNPVNSIKSTCVGRNDGPTTTWYKELSWETMGVSPGNSVTQVDAAVDHAIISRSHSSSPRCCIVDIRASGGATSCLASAAEAELTYSAGTGGTAWATRNATGAVNVNVGACQTSSTTVRIQTTISPVTGNNAAATTQANNDNLVLTITEVTPSSKRRVIIARLRLE